MGRLETRKPIAVPLAILALSLAAVVTAVVVRATDAHHAAVGVLATLAVGMIIGAFALVPWTRWPISNADKKAALAGLPQEDIARSKALHRAMQPVAVSVFVVTLATNAVIGLTPIGATAISWLSQPLGGSYVVQIIVGATGITLLSQALVTPLAVWKHKVLISFGLSIQPWGAWVKDQLKGLALSSVFLGLMLACIYSAVALSPQWWWLWASSLLAVMMALVGLVFPIWIAPIFNRFKPLEDGDLRDQLIGLARRDGVRIHQLYVADASRRTKAHNASMAGYGPTRRIILYDNLLNPAMEGPPVEAANDKAATEAMGDMALHGATPGQIATIVGHELAHAKFQDVAAGMFFMTVWLSITMCSLYLLNSWTWLLHLPGVSAITDPRAIGLFFAVITAAQMLVSPYMNLRSRKKEAAADWHALVLTDDPDSFESAWHNIVRTNLADPDPSRVTLWLFGTHPAIVSRIAMANLYRRSL